MVLRVQRDGAERRLTVEELEAGIVRGEVHPELPILVDGTWGRARDWPAWESLSASPEAALHRLWRAPPVPWVTGCTAGLLLQVALVQALLIYRWADPRPVLASVKSADAIFERGEAWRVLSYGLFHADLGHLSSNAAGLFVAGFGLERLVGRRSALLILALSTLVGGLVSAVLQPQVRTIGISGGVFGLLAAAGVLGLRYLAYIPPGARAAFGAGGALFTVYALVQGSQAERVDNWCHLGGALTGALLGAALRPRIAAWDGWNRGVRRGGALFGAAVLALLALAGPRLVPWTAWDADGARTERPAWWEVQVGRAGQSGYGNGLHGTSAGVDSRRHAAPPTVDQVLTELLDKLRRIDPGAALIEAHADGGSLRYRADGVERQLQARVAVRGLYSTVAVVDTRVDERFTPTLRERVLDGLELEPPDDLAEELAGESSTHWRTRLEAARARAALGELEAARAGYAAARRGGDAAEVDIAELSDLAALRHPDAAALTQAAADRWPDERTVQVAVSRAWTLLGEPERAQAVALRLWTDAPTPGARTSAASLVREAGGRVPDEAPAP